MSAALAEARRLLLELAQCELTGRYHQARALWEPAANALDVVEVGSPLTRELVGRGMVAPRHLLQLALRCTILVRCSCGNEIDGLVWSHCELVGYVHFNETGEHFESKKCPRCGSTRSVRLPDMRAA